MATQYPIEISGEALRRILETSLDTGKATGGDATHLQDTNKNWGTNLFANLLCEITEGTGKGQIRQITANDANTLTVNPAWSGGIIPDNTSQYRIGFFGTVTGSVTADITKWGSVALTGYDITQSIKSIPIDEGTITGGAAGDRFQDSNKYWESGIFSGKLVRITTATYSSVIKRIGWNDTNWIYLVGPDTFPADVVAGCKYSIIDDVGQLTQIPDAKSDANNAHVGLSKQIDEGSVAAGSGANTLNATWKNWEVDCWKGYYVKLIRQFSSANDDIRQILSNTANQLTVASNWGSVPVTYEKFIIFPALNQNNFGLSKQLEEGFPTAVGANTLTDSSKDWGSTGLLFGKIVKIVSGTGAGNIRRILTHTATQITVDSAWTGGISTNSRYAIFDCPLTNRFGLNFTLTQSGVDWGEVQAPSVGTTITDLNKNWKLNCWVGYGIANISFSGGMAVRRIISNTANVLTVDSAITMGVYDIYIIFPMPLMNTDGTPNLSATSYKNYIATITAGTTYAANLYDISTAMGKVGRVLHIKTDQTIRIKLNDTANDVIVIPANTTFNLDLNELSISKVYFDNSLSGAINANIEMFVSG